MKATILRPGLYLLPVCLWQVPTLRGQDVSPPPPPPQREKPAHPGPDQPHRPGPPRPGGSSGMFSHGDHDHMDAFKQLPEEEKQRVRTAFEKTWNTPEVAQARDHLMKANEDYRQALHRALEQYDPEVVKILARIKMPMPVGRSVMPRMPDPNDPEFARKAIASLGMQWQAEHHDMPVMRAHDRVMQAPAVRDLVQQLESAEPGRRVEVWNRLRDAYQAAMRIEFPHREREGPGPRREPPPNNPPPKGPPPNDAPQKDPPAQDKPKTD